MHGLLQARKVTDREQDVDGGLETLLEMYCNLRNLNESQIEAVNSIVMGLLKKEGFRVRLVQGPPGTGKTKTLVALLSIVSCLTKRTLVCTPTNRALSEVAETFLEQFHDQSSELGNSQFSDFESLASIKLRFCRPLQLGDVVMVGNEEKLDTDTPLRKIFLPHRTQLLLKALCRNSGWGHSAQQVVSLLEDADGEYEMYRDGQGEDFRQFMRKRINLIGRDMAKHGQIMIDHLSSKRLSEEPRKCIQDSCLEINNLIEALAVQSLS